MDIRMPGMNGLETTRPIKVRYPDTKIMMLTVSDDENDLFEAVKSCTHGYLLKSLEAALRCYAKIPDPDAY
jgi:DNA-binding NarL/FixJ family response regulator